MSLPLGMSRTAVADALAVAEARRVPVRTLARGDTLRVGAFALTVLWPDYVRPGEENADSLVLPAIDGYMGVEAGHEPVVTAVVPGELKYRSEGAWTHAVVSQGLAEIMPDRVMVLTTSAERPEEIDWKRAEAAKERAEERLRQKLSIQEYYNSKAALARAMARLKAARK